MLIGFVILTDSLLDGGLARAKLVAEDFKPTYDSTHQTNMPFHHIRSAKSSTGQLQARVRQYGHEQKEMATPTAAKSLRDLVMVRIQTRILKNAHQNERMRGMYGDKEEEDYI